MRIIQELTAIYLGILQVIATQGPPSVRSRVKKFSVKYSYDEIHFHDYIENGTKKVNRRKHIKINIQKKVFLKLHVLKYGFFTPRHDDFNEL